MLRSDRPLTRTEIGSILRNISDHPPSISTPVALEAMVVTANSLLSWCDPKDVPLPYPDATRLHVPGTEPVPTTW